jgi:hypothetical protein
MPGSVSVRQLSLSGLVALGFMLGAVGLSAARASAAETHLFQASFGPKGTAATAFEQPAALAVDQSTGEVYVADLAPGTVQKFNALHEPSAFTGVAPNIIGGRLTGFSFATSEPLNQLAVNSTSHDLYVINHGSESLQAYQVDGKPADFTEGPSAGTNEIGGSTFKELCGVAVDANGDIYASDFFNGVEVFSPSGELLAKLSVSFACNAAVDSHGTVYVNHFEGPVEKFTPSTFPVTVATTYVSAGVVDANSSWGVAVDPITDHVYVDEHNQVAEYDGGGTRLDAFGATEPGALIASEGLAVNSASGQVYVSDAQGKRQVEIFGPTVVLPDVTTTAASEVGPRSATLNGTVNPEGIVVTQCEFEYVEAAEYDPKAADPYEAGGAVACSEIPSGSSPVAVHAEAKGLTAGITYHFRLKAKNKDGSEFGEDTTLNTPPPPSITGASVSNLAAGSADLNAQVNPNGLETSYHFEYGATTAYGTSTPTPDEPIGNGTTPIPITAKALSLNANTTYHWRVLATSEAGTTTSPDHAFIYPETGPSLPDNRAYEMVTPPQKNGAVIGSYPFAPSPVISQTGSRIIVGALQCFAGASSCVPDRQTIGTPYSFTRTPTSWTPTPLAPPATTFDVNTRYLPNADEGTELFSAPTPPGGQDDFYARQTNGSFLDIGPLTPPEQGPNLNVVGEIQALAETADLSHIVYETAPVWPSSGKGPTVFEYTHAGTTVPLLVGVSGGQASTDLISECATSFTALPVHEIGLSADGRIVDFQAEPCIGGTGANVGREVPVTELYARVDNGEADAHTVAISQPHGLSPAEPDLECASEECVKDITEMANWREAQLQASSGDGSKVLFTSMQRLTDDAGEDSSKADIGRPCYRAVGVGCNLYLYDFGGVVGRRLVDVSAGDVGGGGARVQGVVAASNDASFGSHVYFVARGVLTGVANVRGQVAREGRENLYVYERDGAYPAGRVSFIAALPEADAATWQSGAGHPGNVTPDGRFLVFTSSGALTADATRTDGAMQVFRYDALTGVLVRVSVGERGFNDDGNGGAGSASIVEGFRGFARAGVARTDPSMSDSGGRVFFMSPVALTSGALGSDQITIEGGVPQYAENVYEWEQPGVGGCSVGEAAGCVSLISDGRDTGLAAPGNPCESASNVCLFGSDAAGANVFFSTVDRLVPQDTDTQLDVYDARVCDPGHGDPCLQPPVGVSPPCLGEACHGTPPASPSSLTPGTAAFNGAGNVPPPPAVKAKPLTRAQLLAKALKACRAKHDRHKRVGCEAQARKKYGPPPKSHKASRHTRAITNRKGGK